MGNESNASLLVSLIASFAFVFISSSCIARSDGNEAPLFRDSVFAMAKISQSDARGLGLDYPNVVAFLGNKKTYMLFEGGDELQNVGQELDGNYFIVRNIYQGLFIKDNQVWGRLLLVYYKGDVDVSAEEKSILEKRGFEKLRSGDYFRGYSKLVNVKGIAFEPVAMTGDQKQQLKISRDLDFYNSEVSPPSVFSKIKTVATTIVTAPLVVVAGVMWGMTVVIMSVTGSH
ncbi:hypothetical protein [Sideroxydans sp. CL21]|uniref:hypothetical protein n=1 Tax=Sideroxydans sp. CL21 TaxID=2600596 RepID=UPI0024BCD51D|nr:hypothetical protein [Sideroxydans sp. CL21]